MNTNNMDRILLRLVVATCLVLAGFSLVCLSGYCTAQIMEWAGYSLLSSALAAMIAMKIAVAIVGAAGLLALGLLVRRPRASAFPVTLANQAEVNPCPEPGRTPQLKAA